MRISWFILITNGHRRTLLTSRCQTLLKSLFNLQITDTQLLVEKMIQNTEVPFFGSMGFMTTLVLKLITERSTRRWDMISTQWVSEVTVKAEVEDFTVQMLIEMSTISFSGKSSYSKSFIQRKLGLNLHQTSFWCAIASEDSRVWWDLLIMETK